jgi:hypothetical protein
MGKDRVSGGEYYYTIYYENSIMKLIEKLKTGGGEKS